MPLPSILLTLNGRILSVEIAATTAARECGLSHRNQLAADRGMLFVYPPEQRPGFWMKDTSLPLSLAFINADHTILELHNMVPQSRQIIASNENVHYALEVNRGWFEQHNVKLGDKAAFRLPTHLDIR